MDRFSRLLGSHGSIGSEPESQLLNPAEIRMIADARTEQLARFAASGRLHAVDPKGDTPLHIAARIGNLALCDLFISAGADPQARNHERQTPADLAFAEGHLLAAQLLITLLGTSQVEMSRNTSADVLQGDVETEERQSPPAELAPPEASGYEIDFPTFEPEEDPEHFFDRSFGHSASGTFVVLPTSPPTDFAEAGAHWEVDLSPTQITGEGIGNSEVATTSDPGGEHDFLMVRKRGRQSAKRVVVPSGTRLSIEPGICVVWAAEVLERRYFSSDDVDALISLCEGNGDPDELRINLLRTLEAAGLELFDGEKENSDVLWDVRSEISAEELAEAVEAIFTRATRLPGIRRFDVDKSREARLLDPMVRAKQELQLGILACGPAVEGITGAIDKVLDGSWKPHLVTMRTIVPSRPEGAETAAFSDAGQVLRNWNAAGRVMDGKRRREALHALEELDLSLTFQRAMVKVLAQQPSFVGTSRELASRISAFESAVEQLVLEHVPYARRFAARNVEDGEDSEDVFQVAFMGLQRSTRRFDPERGHRFVVYSAFWMKQFLTRWRADEGALIRLPVHRHEKLSELNRAVERMDARNGHLPSDDELAIELGWPLEGVRQLLRIRRQCFDVGCLDEGEDAISEPCQEHFLDHAEMARIVSEALAELPERQADVIRMRFGIGRDEEMTLEEIGQIYGVTRERIRQIEAKGLKYLSHPARKRPLQALLGI